MDQQTSILLLLQGFTMLLLIISEVLPLSNSPYSGIFQCMLASLEKETKKHAPK